MSRLLLVRHGETELNSSLRYWGSTDVALSAAGLRQAERLRHRLAEEKVRCIYSSDLKRALATAETIASGHKLGVTACPELREINYGEIEGLTFEEIARLYPEVAKLWIERSPHITYPGGESLAELEIRVSAFRKRLGKHKDTETILIVAHSGVLRNLICQLLGTDMRLRWQIRLDLASITVVDTYPEGAILTRLNDVSHLGRQGNCHSRGSGNPPPPLTREDKGEQGRQG